MLTRYLVNLKLLRCFNKKHCSLKISLSCISSSFHKPKKAEILVYHGNFTKCPFSSFVQPSRTLRDGKLAFYRLQKMFVSRPSLYIKYFSRIYLNLYFKSSSWTSNDYMLQFWKVCKFLLSVTFYL